MYAFLCKRTQACLEMFLYDKSTDSSQWLRKDIKNNTQINSGGNDKLL